MNKCTDHRRINMKHPFVQRRQAFKTSFSSHPRNKEISGKKVYMAHFRTGKISDFECDLAHIFSGNGNGRFNLQASCELFKEMSSDKC